MRPSAAGSGGAAASADSAQIPTCVVAALKQLNPQVQPRDSRTLEQWWTPDALVCTNGEVTCDGFLDVVEHYRSFDDRFSQADVIIHSVAGEPARVEADFEIRGRARPPEQDIHVRVHASFVTSNGRIREMRQVFAAQTAAGMTAPNPSQRREREDHA